ncbi:MAG: YicC family protein [Deltaproteobacteria bacterium]|nr:MAG: YicC family protein [Deltaproteobacteria bacterium]
MSISSMTGFGKGQAAGESLTVGVEVRSVNHRFCDVSIKGPKVVAPFEAALKKRFSEELARGKVDVYINLDIVGEQGYSARANLPLAQAARRALEEMREALGLEDPVTLEVLTRQKDLLVLEEEVDLAELEQNLDRAVTEAVAQLRGMRTAEGEALEEDFSQRLTRLENLLGQVEGRADMVPTEWREKLQQRLNRHAADIEVDPQRLSQELAIFADRCDISEEITRFHSHIGQFRQLLQSGEPVGRKLDFLVQEINREANTIGSKASDAQICNWVVEIKAELEKIREQVQNVV